MISIIVPIYNSEKKLHQCINSILQQTFKEFELILINDGSTDASGLFCDEYAIKDTRIKVFHTENGGVSSARNVGLQNAKGEWICFVDSDDFLQLNFLEVFNKVMDENNESDFYLQGIKKISADFISEINFKDFLQNVEEFFSEYVMHQHFFGPVSKLYKKTIIEANKITFDESLRFGEDTMFNLDYLLHCENIQTINYCGYNYLICSNTFSLSKKEIDFDYDFFLFILAKSKLELIKHQFLFNNDLSNHTYIIFKRMFDSVYLYNDFKRKEILPKIFRSHKNDFLNYFKNGKGRGKICYYLLKYDQIILFDWFYKKMIL